MRYFIILSAWLFVAVNCTAPATITADAQVEPDSRTTDATDAEPFTDATVFAHSATTLYKVDANTLEVTEIANFSFLGFQGDDITDLAIDKDGNMLAISWREIYAVDPDTAIATHLATLPQGFNGLSFLPTPGDPETERLIAIGSDGSAYEIDTSTGDATLLGNFGPGINTSGDIVYVKDFGTVATVKIGLQSDYLARIDEVTFEADTIGPIGADRVWGVGYWGDKVFGFSGRDGSLLLIDPETAESETIDTELDGVKWWGAGVTTRAAVIE